MPNRPVIAPEDCPEPGWHETRRYCPTCTWTENYGKPPVPPTRITARFFVQQIIEHGNFDQITVMLTPAYSEGQNKQWAVATPSGKIEMNIKSDLPAADFFRSFLRDKERDVAVEFVAVKKGE